MFEGAAASAYPAELVYNLIYDFIQPWEDSWLLVDSIFPEDPSLVIQAIINGMAIIVSDGSYIPFLSTVIGTAGHHDCTLYHVTKNACHLFHPFSQRSTVAL
jgi:hypothetical protein